MGDPLSQPEINQQTSLIKDVPVYEDGMKLGHAHLNALWRIQEVTDSRRKLLYSKMFQNYIATIADNLPAPKPTPRPQTVTFSASKLRRS